MYFNSQTVRAAKLAALDHYRLASNILFDSTARLIDLYGDTGSKALELARNGANPRATRQFKELAPELCMNHLRIAGHAHADLIRVMKAQMHNSSGLAKFALDKTADMSPPLVELGIDTAESIMAVGECAADELGDASINAVVAVEKKLARSSRAGKKVRR